MKPTRPSEIEKNALLAQPKLQVEFCFNMAPEEDTNLHGYEHSKTNIHSKAFQNQNCFCYVF